jgi:erythromycin esterase
MIDFKITMVLSILFYANVSKAQISYNGGFEYTGIDNKTIKWFYQPSSFYNVDLDTSTAYKGSKSLHISSTTNATNLTSFTIFQTIGLSDFKNIRSVKVIYNLKLKKGDTTSFIPFVSPQECGRKRSFPKIITWNRKKSEWRSIQAEIRDSLSCNKMFIGFVIAGIVDLNVDDIEIFINGVKARDVPITAAPIIVPKAKEIEWLKNTIKEIASTSDYQDLSDLSFLKKTISNAKVVGLGESTHGTKEFNTLRGRIIKYLIDSLNFALVVFENNIIPTHNVNVLLDSSVSSGIILDSLFGRIHQTEEIAEILDYIRAKKVVVEGFDMQGYAYETKSLLKLFAAEDTVLFNALREMDNYRTSTKFSAGKFDTLHKKAISLYALYKNRMSQRSKNILNNFFIAKQIEAIIEAYYLNFLKYLPITKGSESIRTSTFRDSVMSENILWLMKVHPGKKIIVWGHDGHIKRGFYLFEKNLTMGNFLYSKLGNLYKAFSFTSGNGFATGYAYNGQPRVYNLLEPSPDTYEYYLDQTGVNTGFLNLELTKEILLKNKTIVSALRLRSVGYNYTQGEQFRKTNIADSYNGLFFIKNSTNSKSFHFREE